jgi:sugar phosphate isomerase/epimerase
MSSRRAFIKTVTAAVAGSKLVQVAMAADQRPFAGPFGVQLYSLRKQLQKDVPGSLNHIREVGYTTVETAGFYGLKPEDFKRELDKAGLTCTGMHSGDDNRFREHLEEIIAEAKIFQPLHVSCPWVQEGHRKDAEGCKRVAAEFNTQGKKLQAAGFRFSYHNHDADFKPVGSTTAEDIFIAETDPELVDFELDLYFVQKVGLVPADYLKKYSGRFKQLHLKDIAKGVQPGFREEPDTTCVPLGTGQIDWPQTLAAAAEVGVKEYYVEDESPTAWDGIAKTIAYLKSVRF